MSSARRPPTTSASASTAFTRPGPARGGEAPFAFSTVNRSRMARLFGRAGCLTVQHGGFRVRAVVHGVAARAGAAWDPHRSEKDAKLAQTLDQLQLFLSVL
jgi:hypothetical protein